MTNGLRFREFPESLGSRKFPIMFCVSIVPIATKRIGPIDGANWIMAIRIIRAVIMMLPIVGMKLSTTAMTPHSRAKSSFAMIAMT